MIHLLGTRLGHFSAQLRVSAGRQPTAKIIKTNTHLPSWMRKFLLEGAFSAVSSAYLRGCLFRNFATDLTGHAGPAMFFVLSKTLVIILRSEMPTLEPSIRVILRRHRTAQG